jgi:hypothetical protein
MLWVRRHVRLLAVAVLVSMSTLGAWSLVAHELDDHDHDGAPVFVVHDAAAHAFTSPQSSDAATPVHCVLCHWTRAFGPSVQSISLAPSAARRVAPRQASVEKAASAESVAQPPLRGPPVSPVRFALA